jgi:hypothetical protein
VLAAGGGSREAAQEEAGLRLKRAFKSRRALCPPADMGSTHTSGRHTRVIFSREAEVINAT